MSAVETTATLRRVDRAIRSVMPAGTPVTLKASAGLVSVDVGAGRFTAEWIGEGWLRDAMAVLSKAQRKPDVLVARRMSPGARAAALDAGAGWVDEAGGAEIALPGLLISRTARPDSKVHGAPRWNASVIGTAEALLVGTRPTVAEVERATGLSAGSATNALASLTELGLLRAEAARGRGSAREIVDRHRLLDAYAAAAIARSTGTSLRVGVAGRDLMSELSSLGERWDADELAWAATGAAAAAVLGPYLSEVTGLDVFMEAPTPASLDAVAHRSGLRALDGGRLVLRNFPTPVTRRLCGTQLGIRVVPWPRAYADLRVAGVRGEEAAEQLRDLVDDA